MVGEKPIWELVHITWTTLQSNIVMAASFTRFSVTAAGGMVMIEGKWILKNKDKSWVKLNPIEYFQYSQYWHSPLSRFNKFVENNGRNLQKKVSQVWRIFSNKTRCSCQRCLTTSEIWIFKGCFCFNVFFCFLWMENTQKIDVCVLIIEGKV